MHPNTAPAPPVCKPNGIIISTIACMQDISSTNKASVLASMTVDQQYTLKDSRDGKEYYIARLKDGNIWMTQNLDLDLDSETTYTSADTDIAADWTPMRSTYVTGDTTWDTDWPSVYGHISPESYDPGTLYWNGTTGYYNNETDCVAAGGTWDSDNNACMQKRNCTQSKIRSNSEMEHIRQNS